MKHLIIYVFMTIFRLVVHDAEFCKDSNASHCSNNQTKVKPTKKCIRKWQLVILLGIAVVIISAPFFFKYKFKH